MVSIVRASFCDNHLYRLFASNSCKPISRRLYHFNPRYPSQANLPFDSQFPSFSHANIQNSHIQLCSPFKKSSFHSNLSNSKYHSPSFLKAHCYCTITSAQKDDTARVEELFLSESCIDRLRFLKSGESTKSETDNKPKKFLRLVVEGGGCSGLQYKFELDDKLQNDDRCFGPEDARVVVDEVSLSFVKGSTIDYHKELIRAAFRVVGNPQSEAGCSCGASFSFKI